MWICSITQSKVSNRNALNVSYHWGSGVLRADFQRGAGSVEQGAHDDSEILHHCVLRKRGGGVHRAAKVTENDVEGEVLDGAKADIGRLQDLLDDEIFSTKVTSNVSEKNQILTKIYNHEPLDANQIIEEYKTYKNLVEKHIQDTSLIISNAIKENKNVLFEGAQGTLLDIDHGTYPFVTSSNTSSGNAAIGSGIGPLNFNRVVGVTKAYISRVGSGPFITEQKNEIGDYLIEKGQEFGVVTGRRRRCGWLDLVSLKYSVRINSLSELFITKLDVLSGLEEIKLATSYKHGGKIFNEYPYEQKIQYEGEPVYITLPGWNEDISKIKEFFDLPLNAQNYLKKIEEFIGVPITFISVGPERNQNIVLANDR